MTPADLLKTLETEGVVVSLNLKLEADSEPSDETRALIRDNRDALIAHLAREHVGTVNASQSTGVTLYGDLLNSLMAWVARRYELRLEHPHGVILNARPDHITDALTRYPWGILYTAERHVLLTWGDVPPHALTDKTELQPTAQPPVTAERVVN